jgi:hypothetical protein
MGRPRLEPRRNTIRSRTLIERNDDAIFDGTGDRVDAATPIGQHGWIERSAGRNRAGVGILSRLHFLTFEFRLETEGLPDSQG